MRVCFHQTPANPLAGATKLRDAKAPNTNTLVPLANFPACSADNALPEGAAAVDIDAAEEASIQTAAFGLPKESQKRDAVRRALDDWIYPYKPAPAGLVVEGVFAGFVCQATPLLEKIYPQHAFQPDWRATALCLVVERLDDGRQFGPRKEGYHAREEFLEAGELRFNANSAGES